MRYTMMIIKIVLSVSYSCWMLYYGKVCYQTQSAEITRAPFLSTPHVLHVG